MNNDLQHISIFADYFSHKTGTPRTGPVDPNSLKETGNVGGYQTADSGNDYINNPGKIEKKPLKGPKTPSWESGKNTNKTSNQFKRDLKDIPEGVDDGKYAPWFNFKSAGNRVNPNINNPIHASESHGHVEPLYGQDGGRIRMKCGGLIKCPVCKAEWQSKYKVPYPNKKKKVESNTKEPVVTLRPAKNKGCHFIMHEGKRVGHITHVTKPDATKKDVLWDFTDKVPKHIKDTIPNKSHYSYIQALKIENKHQGKGFGAAALKAHEASLNKPSVMGLMAVPGIKSKRTLSQLEKYYQNRGFNTFKDAQGDTRGIKVSDK